MYVCMYTHTCIFLKNQKNIYQNVNSGIIGGAFFLCDFLNFLKVIHANIFIT